MLEPETKKDAICLDREKKIKQTESEKIISERCYFFSDIKRYMLKMKMNNDPKESNLRAVLLQIGSDIRPFHLHSLKIIGNLMKLLGSFKKKSPTKKVWMFNMWYCKSFHWFSIRIYKIYVFLCECYSRNKYFYFNNIWPLRKTGNRTSQSFLNSKKTPILSNDKTKERFLLVRIF